MRVCPKCRDYYADRLLGFCLADGTPLVDVDPSGDSWSEGVRVIDQKAIAERAQNRTLKWRRVMLRATLMATMVVSVAAVNSSISVTVRQPICIGAFNDLNGDGEQDAGEAGLSGFVFQVSGTDPPKTLTTELEGRACSELPVGSYTVVEQPQDGWIATKGTTRTVTVTAGQAANVSFGNRQETRPNRQERGELGIRVFNDLNGNGARETNEPGLSGFVFQVSGTGPDTTLTTGPDGIGSGVLPIGTYTVVELPQSGWTATTPTTRTVTVTAGQAANILFGSRQEKGKLCITKFDDLNGNGVRDAGERGLSGFVFQVSGTGPARSLTTGPNGDVCSALPAGTYTVVEQAHSGWVATTPTTQPVTVTADQTANMLFGSRQEEGKLCITKFDDLNGNGVRDAGEPGRSGFAFQVRGPGPAAKLKTDLEGGVCSALPVGTYTVIEEPQSGWIATTPTKQTANIVAGQASHMSFGSRQEKGKLCIRKFEDVNGNGVHDDGEKGLSGFVFQVSGTGPGTMLTTGPGGDICSALPVGTYTVVEQPQSGWIATTPTTRTANVVAGKAPNVLFGSRQERQDRGDLCITKFNDLNGNGVRDPGEPDLSGFVFQVRATDSPQPLKTDLKGGGCTALPAGKYTVVERPKPGWIPTTKTTQPATLTANQSVNLLFGSRQERHDNGELCIRKFNDLNGNGVYDAGEPGLSGIVFEVRGTGPGTKLITGLKGEICSSLPAGAYIVVERPQRGWRATTATTQPVAVSAERPATLYFGNTNRGKSDPVCSEADNGREWQIIRDRYEAGWRRIIEGERGRIVAENVPRGTKGVEVSLGPIEYKHLFRRCTLVLVTVRYEWLVQSPKQRKKVTGELRFVCEKAGGGWICRPF